MYTEEQRDDFEDFFGALLEVGHDLEEAFDGVRALAGGLFEDDVIFLHAGGLSLSFGEPMT